MSQLAFNGDHDLCCSQNNKKMTAKNKQIVSGFIETIWNQRQFDQIGNFLMADYVDNSLPPSLPANAEGLKLWIVATGNSFSHNTTIQEMVAEDNKVMLKIDMALEHIGKWREIEPTGLTVHSIGYRYFRLENGKICEHWALIDGNAIENQLKEASHGCKIQK
jgi:predicted ester cyclase